MKNYTPQPIDESDVELHEDVSELREVIAENAHEIWAQQRQKEGWTFVYARRLSPFRRSYLQLLERIYSWRSVCFCRILHLHVL